MFSFTLKRLAALGAIAVLPMACAPGTSGVTPSNSSRGTQSGGVNTGGGGLPGGGGGGGGGGAASTCQPLPGTCVLTATLKLDPPKLGFKGQVRFERSPTRMALTGTLQPGGLGAKQYYVIALDTPAITTTPATGPVPGYAARGVVNPATQTVTLETLPGDGLFSTTPSAMPVAPSFSLTPTQAAAAGIFDYQTFLVDPTPPSAEALALFAAVHAGSSVYISWLVTPSQTCPCPAPGTPVIPEVARTSFPAVGTLQ